MAKRAFRLLVTAAVVLTFAACSSEGSTSTPAQEESPEVAALNAAARLWNETEPAEYQYVINRRCLNCTPAVAGESALVKVEASGESRISPLQEGSTTSDLTIDDAFGWLRGFIDSELYVRREVTYDSGYGFIADVLIMDPLGHGWRVEITDFEVLGG